MTRSRLRNSTFLAGWAGLLLAPMPVVAQQTEVSANNSIIEELIVTANRREQSVVDVAGQVQSITGADLENSGFTEISDILEVVPGASVVSRAAAGFETIQLRGIASGTVGDATVGYYIDNVPFSIPNLQLVPPSRLFDLQRAEVLRGPQGTLYGQGAMGGAIRLITNEPDPNEWEVRARVEASWTEDGEFGFAGDGVVNVPVVEDTFGIRITGGYEMVGGFADDVLLGIEDANDVESFNIRGQFQFTPTDNLLITLSAWRIENSQDYSNAIFPDATVLGLPADTLALPLNTLPGSGFGTDTPFVDTELTIGSGFIRYDFSFATLESATAYTVHELDLLTSAGSDFSALLGLPPLSFVSPITNASTFSTNSFTHETRLISSGGPFEWIVGGFVTDAEITSSIDVNVLDAIGLLTVEAPLETTSFAFFGEISKSFFDGRLTPLFGIRYFRDDRSASGTTLFGPFVDGAIFPIVEPFDEGSGIFDAVSPRFSVVYGVTEEINLYASATRGFRSGSIQTGGQVSLAATDGIDTDVLIEDDSLWTFEWGTKGTIFELLGGTLAFDLAGFYTIWSDIQIPFTTSAGLAATVNGGDVRIVGFDGALIFDTPIPGLRVSISGNFTDAIFTDVVDALDAALAGINEDDVLPSVPRSTFSVGFDYVTEIVSGYDLFANGRYSFRDEQSDAATGSLSGDVELLSFRLGVSTENWSIEGFVDNALNDIGPAVGIGSLAIGTVQPLYPRRAGVSATFNY